MPLKTNSADFGMDYNLSPPFLSGLISSHPTTPNPTTHPPAKLGGGGSPIPRHTCTVLTSHRWVPLPSASSFHTSAIKPSPNTNPFVLPCQHPPLCPPPPFRTNSSLPSLCPHCTGNTALLWGFSTLYHNIGRSLWRQLQGELPRDRVVSCSSLCPPKAYTS